MCVLADKSTSETDPLPPGTRWINMQTAKNRSGKSIRTLQHLCQHKWEAAGLSRRVANPNGGHDGWEIHESADLSLHPCRQPENIPFDQSGLTDAQRDELNFALRCVLGWEKAESEGVRLGWTKEKSELIYLEKLRAEQGRAPSVYTLRLWIRDYRRDGAAGLVDGRWGQPANCKTSSPEYGAYFEFLKQIYLTPRRVRISKCIEIANARASQEGWKVPSGRTARRYLQKLPPQLVIKCREGESAFVAKCEPYIERDYSQLASNEIWNGDHHRPDVMIRHGNHADGKPRFVRPWITAWQDVGSRKIVGWCIYVHDPNTDTILEAFLEGCRSHGIPLKVQIDNGKDFDSRALQGITKRQRHNGQFVADNRCIGAFNLLEVGVQHVWPYHGQSKPIERFFGTVCEGFSKIWDTYCGNAPHTKPENLQRQLELGRAPTLEEFCQAFGEWLERDYHGRMHLGDSMNRQTPAAVFKACLESKRTLPDETLTFACMPRTKPVTIGRHGVTYKGLHFGANNLELAKRFGQKVMLAIDNNDLSRVLIVDLEGRLVCSAKANIRIPFNAKSEDLREAIAEKKKTRRMIREYHQRRTHLSLDNHQLLNRAAAERIAVEKSPAPAPALPPLKLAQTSIETAPSAIRDALEGPSEAIHSPEQMPPDDFRSVFGNALRRIRSEREELNCMHEEQANGEIDVFAALSKAVGGSR